MIPDFWTTGASLVVYAAHEAEVAPMIQRHKLKRVPREGQSSLYQHRDVDLRVVVNGESGVSCLLTTGMALTGASSHTRHLLVGTSGHASLPIGQWYHPSMLMLEDVSASRRLYPSLDGASHFESSPHKTRGEFQEGYPEEGGVDLESYYWFQALSRQVRLDSIGIVRLVTDSRANPLGENVELQLLKRKVHDAWSVWQNELDAWFHFHAERSAAEKIRERVFELPPELEAFRWSQSQLVRVRRCVERARILNFELAEFCSKAQARSLHRKELLESLEGALDELGVDLHG